MQFGFSDNGAHMHLPHQYMPGFVAYTGTHDNDTTLGWWNTANRATEERGGGAGGAGGWTAGVAADSGLRRPAWRTSAVMPAQDLLELDSEARMNTPSVGVGNWGWRAPEGCWTAGIAARLAEIAEVTDRGNDPLGTAEV